MSKTAGKHPRWAKGSLENGLHDASSDPAQVMEWWGQWSEANIGLRTGDGMFVVDADGEAGWRWLEERGIPCTLTVRTGRGVHLYLFVPEGVKVRNRARIAPEVDVRGDGGYVLAPPSVHASGAVYEWIDQDVQIADAPEWLIELVREREAPERPVAAPVIRAPGDVSAYARRALTEELERLAGAPEGTRNQTLNEVVFNLGTLVAGGELPESLVADEAWGIARAIGLEEREVRATIASALRASSTKPRVAPEPRTRREAPIGASPGTAYPAHIGADQSSPGIVAGPYAPAKALNNGNGAGRPHVLYPLEVWPAQVAEFIEQTAVSVCVAPEAVGTCVLAVAAGVIGHARWLAVKDDWIERPGIYAGLVASSGERKSPAIRQVAAPLEAIQAEHIARWRREVEEWQETPGKKAKPELSGPVMKDVTTEAVAAALMSHPRGVVLLRDELVGLVKSFGQYKGGKGDDRQKWLEAWNGGTMLIRRRGSDPIAIEHPCLSVLGGIQPAVFDALRAEDDGLAERFLYDVMPTVPLRASTPAVSRQVRGTWEAIVRELYRLPEREVVCEAEGCMTEARQRVLDARVGMSAGVRAWYGKGEAHLARIAIVLATMTEVCDGATGRLEGAVVERAERLLGFYQAQAATLFTGDVVPARAFELASPAKERELVMWLRSRGGSATKREAMNGGPLQRLSAKEAELLLVTAELREVIMLSREDRGRVRINLVD